MRIAIPAIAIVGFVSVGLVAQGPAPAPAAPGSEPQIVWSPKASAPAGWTSPHKPYAKLADLLTQHKGQKDWAETMVATMTRSTPTTSRWRPVGKRPGA
jgi:hypothetical protein